MDPAAELTLLAPTNDAFAALDPSALAALLEAPKELAAVRSPPPPLPTPTPTPTPSTRVCG